MRSASTPQKSSTHRAPQNTASKASRSHIRRSPSYLFLQGTIYYFRYVFPEEMKRRFNLREIRLSLRTGFILEARTNARQLRAYLEELLMKKKDETLTRADIRTKLAAKLEELLNSCPEKQPPSMSVIRQRMDKLRQDFLDSADANLYKPVPGVLIDKDGNFSDVSPSTGLDHAYQMFMKDATNSPEMLLAYYYPDAIIRLLKDKVFKPHELTRESILQILNEYHKTQITINRILAERENGNFGYERQFYTNSSEETNKIDNIQNQCKQLSLSELIEKYISTKISDKQWTERNIATHRGRIETIIDILGDKNVMSISRDDIRNYRDILTKLPPNRKKEKKYKDKSIGDIIAMQPTSTLSIKTINVILQTISGMFEWGIREGLIEKNPARGLTFKDERQESELRSPFSSEEIKTIFFSGDYTQDRFKNPAYYWVPLIGLYTGMRLEEICQLHCGDIYKEEGIWVIDININSNDNLHDKELKTKNAVRKIPVHTVLQRLGLIDYLKKIKKESVRLFPLLNKTKKSPKYGKQVGKQFSAWLKRKKLKTDTKSFHSLRHTFSDFFKVRNMHSDLFRQIFGHEIPELAGRQYGSKFSVKQCYTDLISILEYEGEPKGGQP